MPPRWDYFSGRPLFYTDVVPTELKIPECPQLPKSAQSVSSAIQTRTGLTQCAVMHVAWINGIQVSVWHEPGRVHRRIALLRTILLLRNTCISEMYLFA